jgi:Kelch motif
MINGLCSRAAAFTVALFALTLDMTPAAHAQGKWRTGTPIPQGANEVIGAEIDGQVLVYGGQDPGNNAMGIFWKFDPAKNEWSKLPSNPVPVHHGASASIGRKFYVFGGFRLPDTGKVGWYPENKAWVFDLDTQKWSALPPMPTTRGALAAVAVGKKIYVSGGAGIPQGMQLRWPGRPLRYTRGIRHRQQCLVKTCADADPAQPPQHHLCRWQAVCHRRAGGLMLFGRLVVERVDERVL